MERGMGNEEVYTNCHYGHFYLNAGGLLKFG